MEVLRAFAGIICCFGEQNSLYEPLARQCNYLKNPSAKLEKLKKKMEELNAQTIDVKRKLDPANVQQGMKPKAEVVLWLENVQKIQSAMDLIAEEAIEQKRCCCESFPNYWYRLKLGKQIDQIIEEAFELLKKGRKFSDDPLLDFLPERGKMLPTATIVGRNNSFDMIWEYLMNEDIGRFGVHGLKGVGKTTIMTQINNRLLMETARSVIWVTAPKEFDHEELQNNVAVALDLHYSASDDPMTRAAKLLKALKRRNQFVLIIDDLREPFNLQDIGIPDPTRENGCKLIIITRSLRVCRGMETVREVEVDILSEEEAWDLFEEKVGEDVLSSSAIQSVAGNIVEQCGGLPSEIIAVGRALRKENNVIKWRNKLRELMNCNASVEEMGELVPSRLRRRKRALAKAKNLVRRAINHLHHHDY